MGVHLGDGVSGRLTGDRNGGQVERPSMRRNRRLPRLSKTAVILLVAAAYVVSMYISGWLRVAELKREIAGVERQLEEALAQKTYLEQELKYLQSPAYIEERARRDIGLVMPGETVYRLVEPAPDADSGQ